MQEVLDRLKYMKHRRSTADTYHRVWNSFNKFLIKLDDRPRLWEDKTQSFCAYLVDQGSQSSTVKSYVSAIKSVLQSDEYEWKDERLLLSTITRACKLSNDQLRCRFPIRLSLLEVILFEIERYWSGKQPFLETMYKTMFALGYYGMLRISELSDTGTGHTLKVKDVHVGVNKDKILLILFSSKTHDKSKFPQEIKITSVKQDKHQRHRHFCPFKLSREYMRLRGDFFSVDKDFFVLPDKTKLTGNHVRLLLKILLKRLNIDASLYNTHSLRIGRTCDMLRCRYTINQIKQAGRWKSNAVYRYLH